MNAIATTRHLLGFHFRHERLGLAIFLLLSVSLTIAERLTLSQSMGGNLLGLVRLLQVILFIFLVSRIFLTESPSDPRAQWWTRPIGVSSLLASKVALIAVGLCLPTLLISLLGWVADGYTLNQLGAAAAELTLYMLALGALVGGLAAGASHGGALIATLLLAALACLVSVWLSHLTSWRAQVLDNAGWRLSPPAFAVLLAATLITAGGGGFLTLMGNRRRVWRLAGLALLALSPFWMPLLSPHKPLRADAPPSGIQVAAPSADIPPYQILLGNLAVDGLPADHAATPIQGRFAFASDKDAHPLAFFDLNPGPEMDLMDSYNLSPTGHAYLQAWLPPGVRLLDSNQRFYPGHLSVDIPSNGFPPAEGHLSGVVSFTLHQWVHVGEHRLEAGLSVAHQGHRFSLANVAMAGSDLMLEVQTSAPRLLWSDPAAQPSHRPGLRAAPDWVILLTAPASRQAHWTLVRSYARSGPLSLNDQTYSRVHLKRPGRGTDTQDLRLHLFRLVPSGHYRQAFSWDDHQVNVDVDADGRARPGALAEAKPEDLQSLADLLTTPQPESYQAAQVLQERAQEAIRENLSDTLARVPWPHYQHRALVEVLKGVPRPELPENLAAALTEDPRLFEAVEGRPWATAYLNIVRDELAKRNPLTPPAVLRVAVSHPDVGFHDDLAWHFLHNQLLDRESFYPSLQRMPDLAAPPLLLAAWNRAQLGGDLRDLTLPALEAGLPGALENALRQLHVHGVPPSPEQSPIVAHLRKHIPYEGSWETFYVWLTQHATRLVYDPQTATYQLP